MPGDEDRARRERATHDCRNARAEKRVGQGHEEREERAEATISPLSLLDAAISNRSGLGLHVNVAPDLELELRIRLERLTLRRRMPHVLLRELARLWIRCRANPLGSYREIIRCVPQLDCTIE